VHKEVAWRIIKSNCEDVQILTAVIVPMSVCVKDWQLFAMTEGFLFSVALARPNSDAIFCNRPGFHVFKCATP